MTGRRDVERKRRNAKRRRERAIRARWRFERTAAKYMTQVWDTTIKTRPFFQMLMERSGGAFWMT
jgi:hypothetical protein